jgi:hypothetical protein
LQTNVSAVLDIANTPFKNMLIVIIGIPLILLVVAFIIKQLKVTQLGPFKFGENGVGMNKQYELDLKVEDLDKVLSRKLKDIIEDLKKTIFNNLSVYQICNISKRAITSISTLPYYKIINGGEIAKTLNVVDIIELNSDLLNSIQADYIPLSNDAVCNVIKLPSWEELSKIENDLFKTFYKKAGKEVIASCKAKIEIYENSIEDFKDLGEKKRVEILNNCIDKNTKHIKAINELIS